MTALLYRLVALLDWRYERRLRAGRPARRGILLRVASRLLARLI